MDLHHVRVYGNSEQNQLKIKSLNPLVHPKLLFKKKIFWMNLFQHHNLKGTER